MTINCLCIGGPLDGCEREVTREQADADTVIFDSIDIHGDGENARVSLRTETYQYGTVDFTAGDDVSGERYPLLVHTSLTATDILRRLLENYSPSHTPV